MVRANTDRITTKLPDATVSALRADPFPTQLVGPEKLTLRKAIGIPSSTGTAAQED
jgi:hypothetical protein